MFGTGTIRIRRVANFHTPRTKDKDMQVAIKFEDKRGRRKSRGELPVALLTAVKNVQKFNASVGFGPGFW